MDGTDAKRRSVVEQLVRKSAPRQEPEIEAAAEAYQEACARSREALMLDVVFPDGTVESFDYASLRRVKYRPDGTIILQFGRCEVTAEGKNLMRLREQITEHRARFIQQGTDAELRLKPEDTVHIERIVITEGEE